MEGSKASGKCCRQPRGRGQKGCPWLGHGDRPCGEARSTEAKLVPLALGMGLTGRWPQALRGFLMLTTEGTRGQESKTDPREGKQWRVTILGLMWGGAPLKASTTNGTDTVTFRREGGYLANAAPQDTGPKRLQGHMLRVFLG